MKTAYKFLRFLPVLLFGVYINYLLIRDADEESIFDAAFQGVLLMLFLLTFLWVNLKDRKEYKQTRSKLSLIPTITGILVILSLIATDYLLKARDNSPVLIQAGSGRGIGTSWFEFREDGTYKFVNSGGIGASYYRGSYAFQDSIIMLDTSNVDDLLETNTLAIVKIQNHDDPAKKYGLYQIDAKRNVIEKAVSFTVNMDNRKK